MTEQSKQTSAPKQRDASNDPAPQPNDTPDTEAAERAGVSEGEIKALRDDAGINGLAGHQANVAAWESSDAGQEFVKAAKDESKDAEKAAKDAHADLDKDGRTEAQKEYEEKVSS